MPEDDLAAIGLLRRRVNALETTLDDCVRRIAVLEGLRQPRPAMRGTGSAQDPDLAEAELRRQQAYEEGNARHPLPLSGTREVDDQATEAVGPDEGAAPDPDVSRGVQRPRDR